MSKRRQRGNEQRRKSQADSNTYRFFVPPGALGGRDVVLDDPALVHQLGSVLRLNVADQITLLDDSGWEYAAQIASISRDAIGATIVGKTLAATEPQLKLALYVAILRGERFEWVLQKGTELGVTAFVPVVCQRSVVDDIADIGATKLERWERIIREAAEQSRRAKLPKLRPAMLFDAACEHALRRAQPFVLWEGDGGTSLRTLLRQTAPGADAPFSIALFSGPEGGFTPTELATAQMYQITLASLGPRTLRAETAPIVAATAVLWERGDLD